MSKYHAIKITTPDGTFDSKREYARWCELKLLQKAHEITDLRRQVSFTLIPSQKYDGGTEKAVRYVADFQYYDKYGKLVVEDAKGVRTKEYVIKRKLMLQCFGIHVQEV